MVQCADAGGAEIGEAIGVSTGQNLAELYGRWGRCVFEAHGSYFTDTDPGSGMFTPVADHGDYSFTREQSAEILARGRRGWVLRYPTTTQSGLPGGAYVCTDPNYDLPHLAKRMRNYVRRGQEQCEVRPLDQAELTRFGLRLNMDTDQRHERMRPEFCDERRWASTAAAVFASPGAFAMGAYTGGELASYQVGVLDGCWAYALIQMSRTDLLEAHPNHVLDFAFHRFVFAQPGIRGVSIGPVPLRVNEGLHNYKIRMGFEVRARNTALRLHPWLAPVGTSAALAWAVARARQFGPLGARLEGLEIAIKGSRITAREEGSVPFSPVAEEERESI